MILVVHTVAEFLEARGWISSLHSELRASMSVGPGFHLCNFGGDQRNPLVERQAFLLVQEGC